MKVSCLHLHQHALYIHHSKAEHVNRISTTATPSSEKVESVRGRTQHSNNLAKDTKLRTEIYAPFHIHRTMEYMIVSNHNSQ
jgi:hypothetical protein